MIPLFLVAVVVNARQTPVSRPAAVREQDIDATELLDRFLDKPIDVLAVSQVGLDECEVLRHIILSQ
ncbi:hypothetical protein RRF57_000357 [Xylaria bambusicola]|uniref:Uncharacterized protein n=1 Tax=Xylaria bambusicola TaxID=326684 RepID=A0AAN7UC00_9PEZI